MVCGGDPSSFAISVSTDPITGVEISISGSTETSWLTLVSSSGSEEEGQKKEGSEVDVEERYSYPAPKTKSAMQGALSALPYPPPSSSGAAVKSREIRGEGGTVLILSRTTEPRGGTSPLDGGSLGSNSEAGGSGDGDHPD